MTLQVFISYSHNNIDRPLLDQLRRHLAPIVQTGKITLWDDSQISPGEEWDDAIRQNLEEAQIIVFLVSSDYLASDYVNRIEVPVAMRRAEAGLCAIVPVLLRPCMFDWMPYARFEFLPKRPDNQRLEAVSAWPDTDAALEIVVRRISELIKKAGAKTRPPASDAGHEILPENFPTPLADLERSGLEQQFQIATQKLQKLQTALLLETDAARQFAYEHEIRKLETLIAGVRQKLEA
jgi:hypothetical protein